MSQALWPYRRTARTTASADVNPALTAAVDRVGFSLVIHPPARVGLTGNNLVRHHS